MKLSNAQRRYLRGLTHHINPVVMVGDKGLTDNVWNEIDTALDHHELIKVKLRSERKIRKAQSEDIAHRCDAQIVHQIGQVSCFFRRNQKKPVISLPAR
ncbi:MAG: ribosome assembly RNA-binding protein YhbY [Xanthomonadales bacterium]|nr:ribosome assembly RNA-binding protein YhbY [Xanthomonadales bacterium]NNL94116.1 ribosome assembly RNA-binding protein YhbY [Xanthomonadales bacterium]